ncbi:bifunctional diaminohydroxyphosphoribosylaminopyrimidine deaminase/5-amino-6-(5-phosphoribosylamino)uracil reductase RibD [Lactobacillus sp. DCY120]|uniref:Riboflavin biosynthesis protein RibD n=2 Tax=Bombilactobacillus apium TaxID=2675299 RepID=A0A850R652_9LACO|nr:bifunctional diaminohydroxyphosphoribosylaminopyrimidine deaminase/5-amino-6-(5-phosphoribosylamino)uracil reductase RibD [Bombilactobacillus apium]
MNLAWQQARQGQGQTWTNPLVGVVIVKSGQILAQGYHHHFGNSHAEIDALSQLTNLDQAQGATMYVTLEPCSHTGKTPPCARKLVAVGLARVVIGQLDPNPLVAGKGLAILQAAGITTRVLDQSGGLNRAYNFFYLHKRPLITLKYAASLDGKINAAGNERTYFTGPETQNDSQKERAQQQAILVGERTLEVDDPQLTVRKLTTDFPPRRLVLVRDVDQISRQARLFQSAAPIWFLSRRPSQRSWSDNVQIFVDPQWNPLRISQFLAEQGIQSLFVEGGSQVQAHFMAAGLVDRIVLYLAPLLLGGSALPIAQGIAAPQALKYQLQTQQVLGDDLKLEYWRR